MKRQRGDDDTMAVRSRTADGKKTTSREVRGCDNDAKSEVKEQGPRVCRKKTYKDSPWNPTTGAKTA